MGRAVMAELGRHGSDEQIRASFGALRKIRASFGALRTARPRLRTQGDALRFLVPDTDTQLKAKDAVQKALSPDPEDPAYVVALNLYAFRLADLQHAALQSAYGTAMYLVLAAVAAIVRFLISCRRVIFPCSKSWTNFVIMRSINASKVVQFFGKS